MTAEHVADGQRRGADAGRIALTPWQDRLMAEHACPECNADFATVWHVTVGTNPQGYEPVFGEAPVEVEMGRCARCNVDFQRVDGGPWHRQGDR